MTNVSVSGSHVLINDAPSKLLGFRVASAAHTDDWTDALIREFPLWREHGVNAISLWLTGSSGGFARVFTVDGAISTEDSPVVARVSYGYRERFAEVARTSGTAVFERTMRICAAAAEHGIVVVIGVVYRHALEPTDTRERLAAMMRSTAEYFAETPNVILNPFNEPDGVTPLESVADLDLYVRTLKSEAPERPAGAGGRAADPNPAIAALGSVEIVLTDAGRDLESSIAAYDELADCGKPVMNVESFGGNGRGHADDPTFSVASPPEYTIEFPEWRRVVGAWEIDDYHDGGGKLCQGRQSYESLIEYVGGDTSLRNHLLVHAGAWFQGAGAVPTVDKVGAFGRPGTWTNVFHLGHGTGDGTAESPGIGWILRQFKAIRDAE
ncbi:MAG: hypothetical protein EA426_04435 [Spirochaetaceae bacterium]|nr:MAG: hypothetical protein EA426_04435 [Spirochaetaceae bacterium]